MTIVTEITGKVLVVTINRPQAMNSLDPKTDEELSAAWQLFEDRNDLHVAVLTGAGSKAFSAGADLKAMLPVFRNRVLAGEDNLDWAFGGGLARGRTLEKPVIAAVNGHCLAGGLEMALACDIRVCSPNATFSLAEALWAIAPGAGGTQRLPRAIPASMAMEMLLTGDPIDAETALRVGLVNRIVPVDELTDSAVALATKIASRGPLAIKAIKRLVRTGIMDPQRGHESELEEFIHLIRTKDAQEGYSAFAEKRVPVYIGE
jgi:enoyl-CoA hydratase/carnithine racemase